ncbi:hypothetical protein CCMA1212_005689 [Trichoderma ghanense]|uniref:BZIP domain-containing protein n=1 Tax=Trichoderma ghanense TaxID=65468 RepID=A0ABY2H4L5_9HYPO
MLNAEDEWRGTTNPDLRRRVQNRLNQRAYRLRRRRMLDIPDKTRGRAANETTSAAQCLDQDDAFSPATGTRSGRCLAPAGDTDHSERLDIPEERLANRSPNMDARIKPAPWYTDPAAVAAQFRALKLGRHAKPPPSNDHLLCIMQFNVMRAFGIITSMIGLSPTDLLEDDTPSPFSSREPSLARESSAHLSHQVPLPGSLSPTSLQRSVPHHPWIDILPFPQMRDNLLRLEAGSSTASEKHQYDADSLCHWMIGLDTGQKESGLILWGEPWDIAAWEYDVQETSKPSAIITPPPPTPYTQPSHNPSSLPSAII